MERLQRHIFFVEIRTYLSLIYNQVENFTTFLEFENGVIVDDSNILIQLISTVKSILEPIIFRRRLSGKIRIESLNKKITIGYEDVKPFEYVAELIQAIRKSSSPEIFG